MKITTISLIAALAMNTAFADENMPLLASPMATEASTFDVSANMAITSNYLWRGVSQTSNSMAVQGGIDLGYNGFYLGVWGSNISWTADNTSSLEADLYAGYAGDVAGIGYDIGYIVYAYPNVSDDNNFEEAYIGLSKDFQGFSVNGKYSFGMDAAADDYEVGLSTELAGLGFAAAYGDYDTVGTRYSIAVSKEIGKFELSLGYHVFTSDAGTSGDEDHIVATISTSF